VLNKTDAEFYSAAAPYSRNQRQSKPHASDHWPLEYKRSKLGERRLLIWQLAGVFVHILMTLDVKKNMTPGSA
jgi:hypothetical protein